MRIQLWRNATLKLTLNNANFLIDPMLGEKGSFGAFPWTDDKRKNPLINLPFDEETLREELKVIDAVIVTHLHPDHWDAKAIALIDKNTPIICPQEIAAIIKFQGFKKIEEIQSELTFGQVSMVLTEGQHGKGEIGNQMGKVNGFVLKYQDKSIYIAGDTIWCNEVKNSIKKHSPKHIVVAGGAATFSIGEAVTMTTSDIKEVASYAQNAAIWITHLDTVSPCTEDSDFIKRFLKTQNLESQCHVLENGVVVNIL